MEISIYCPNCQSIVGRDVFAEADEPRDYDCKKCNTVFYLSLVDKGDQTSDKVQEGSWINLTIINSENFPWRNLDESFEPILTCPLCTGDLGRNKDDINNQTKKCRKCGLILNINLEKDN